MNFFNQSVTYLPFSYFVVQEPCLDIKNGRVFYDTISLTISPAKPRYMRPCVNTVSKLRWI